MQIPYRKPGKFSQMTPDPKMTRAKFIELKNKLAKLKADRPNQAAEVARLADLGDFSENVAYQYAKGRLRGLNERVLNLESQLARADVITSPKNSDTVQIGHTVTIINDDKLKTFQILGSSETNPQKGIISQHSPLGAALLGKSVGDIISVKLTGKEVKYKIVKIV